MDKKILSKCGYRCDLCLAYKPNVDKKDQRQDLSDGWYDIYGFRIDPENIYCEGCVSSDSPVLIDNDCPVRPCVVSRALEHCGSCDEFVCDKHRQRGVNRADIEDRLGRKLDKKAYERFVKPYESEDRIKRMRVQATRRISNED
jgi:hypothetical protein